MYDTRLSTNAQVTNKMSPTHLYSARGKMAFNSSAFALIFVWIYISTVYGLLKVTDRPQCNQTLTNVEGIHKASQGVNTRSADYVLCVNLRPTALYYISYVTTDVEYTSVIISGNGSVVKCEAPSTELPLDDYTRFTLAFSNSSLVVIEGVHFQGCLRPLQFKWVTRVELISSSFR